MKKLMNQKYCKRVTLNLLKISQLKSPKSSRILMRFQILSLVAPVMVTTLFESSIPNISKIARWGRLKAGTLPWRLQLLIQASYSLQRKCRQDFQARSRRVNVLRECANISTSVLVKRELEIQVILVISDHWNQNFPNAICYKLTCAHLVTVVTKLYVIHAIVEIRLIGLVSAD